MPNVSMTSKGWLGSNAPKKAKGARAYSAGADCSAVVTAVQVMHIAGDDRRQKLT